MQTAEAQFHEDYLALAKRLFTARAVGLAYHALKKALVCSPGSTAAVSLLGNIRLATGSKRKALAAFRRAFLLDERSDPRVWMNYGNALLVANDGPRAVDIFRAVLRLDPDHVMAKTQLAVWHLKADEEDLARPHLIDLTAQANMPPRAALVLADALRAFGARNNARPFYDRAICPNPTVCRAAYFGRAMASRQPKMPEAAIMDFRRASILNPSDEETARELAGFALHSKVEKASTLGARALCYGVRDAGILRQLIDIAVSSSDAVAAELHLEALVAEEPLAPSTQAKKIAVLRLRNDLSGLEAMADALPMSSETPAGLWNELLLALDEYKSKAVLEHGSRALKAYPEESVLCFNHGLFHFHNNAYDQSLRLFRKALLLSPSYAKALNQASVCLSGLYEHDQADTFSRRCLMIDSNQAVAWMNRGLFAKARRRLPEGIAYLRRAISLADGSYPDATYNLALNLMAIGKIEQGFKHYRLRWMTQTFAVHERNFPQPEWPGPQAAPDADLLVYMEQGMGDEVLFSWILPWVRDDCRALTVECDERLVTTFKRTFADITFVPRRPVQTKKLERREFDYQLPLVQTAEFYGERIHCKIAALSAGADLRGQRLAPRLRTDPARLTHWRTYLAETFGDRLTVGVAWRSGFHTRLRDQQYLTPEELARALPPRIAVINLQYDHIPDEVAALTTAGGREGFNFVTPPDINLRDDLDDIFALIEALDVVVSPLISTPWMAAAVGTPSLVFRSNENGHIWQQFSQRYIPWAPNIKLFFRSPEEPWDGPIAGIRADVARQLGG